jgi:ParB family transcriptional regulator, chromosome partitioning protein
VPARRMAKKGNKRGATLAALLPDKAAAATGDESGRVRQVPIEEVRPNRFQPRKTFDPAKLQELVASVRANGIIQPVLVRLADGGYELIAGERRYRAACMAGLKAVPAIVQTLDQDADALELALIENIQREDLNPIEEAEAYQSLMEQHGYTQERLSRKLGRARATVANTLRLLRLPGEVQEAICTGAISTGHGKALLAVEHPDEVRELLRRIVEGGLNVRQTEELVRRHTTASPGPEPPVRPEPSPQLRSLSDRLGTHLETRVDIVERRGGGGRIVVDFVDGEDLNRIVETIERVF